MNNKQMKEKDTPVFGGRASVFGATSPAAIAGFCSDPPFGYTTPNNSNVFNTQPLVFGAATPASLSSSSNTATTRNAAFSVIGTQNTEFEATGVRATQQLNQGIGLFNQSKPMSTLGASTASSTFGCDQMFQTNTGGLSFANIPEGYYPFGSADPFGRLSHSGTNTSNTSMIGTNLFGQGIAATDPQQNTGSIPEDIGSAIRIDLGMTNVRVGVYKNDEVQIIENEEGKKITPLIIAFTAKGKVLIGDKAKTQLIENPENTISNIQRLMGREWGDQIVQETMKMYAFKIIEKDGKPHVKVETKGEKIFAPEKICAMIILKMKKIAEKHLGKVVTKAVVTVPANFNDAQRRAIKDAVALSRLKLLKLINAPSDAYGLDEKEEQKIVFVYSLGGGIFDASVISIEDSNYHILATNGGTRLSEENFYQRVLNYFIELFKNKKEKDIDIYNEVIQKLRDEIQKAKVELSAQEQNIQFKSFFESNDFMKILTRAKSEESNEGLFESTNMSVKGVQKRDGKNIKQQRRTETRRKKDINEVILVGGSSRITKIQELLKESFKVKELYSFVDSEGAGISVAAAQARSELSGDFLFNAGSTNPPLGVTARAFGGASQTATTGLFSNPIPPFGANTTTTSVFTLNYTTTSNTFNAQTKLLGASTATPFSSTSNTATTQNTTFSAIGTHSTGSEATGVEATLTLTLDPNQSKGLFNQSKPTFSFGAPTAFSFGQTSQANTGSLFGAKPTGTGFGMTTGLDTNSTVSTFVGATQNTNTSLFNSSFKPAGQTTAFSFGITPAGPKDLGNTESGLFTATSKPSLCNTAYGTSTEYFLC